MLPVSVAGVIAAPISQPGVLIGTFNPSLGGRRTYTVAANPDFTDAPGFTWAANPLAGTGWKKEVWFQADQFELNAGFQRTYRLFIGGTDTGVQQAAGGPTNNSASWVQIPDGVSGAMTWQDNINDDETAYTGNVSVYYRYSRV